MPSTPRAPRPEPPRAPPPELWAQILIAVQLLVVGLGLTFAGDLLRGPGSRFVRLNAERVTAYDEAIEGGVVLLGNSILKTAIDDGGEPPVLRIVDDHAFFDNFEALLPAVEAARPEVVVVQAELLAVQPTWRTQVSRFRVAISSTLAGSDDVEHVQFGPVCPGFDEALALPTLTPETLEAMRAEHLEWLHTMTVHDVDAEVPLRAQAFVRRLAEAGTDVVLLELPRAQALAPDEAPALAARRPRLEALAASSERIHLLEVPPQPDALYCDLRHFNLEGRPRIDALLRGHLAALD